MTSKEIATVINMQVEAANNAYEYAARGGETDVSEERCIADATHAELLKALYEIAYQLAVQNERIEVTLGRILGGHKRLLTSEEMAEHREAPPEQSHTACPDRAPKIPPRKDLQG